MFTVTRMPLLTFQNEEDIRVSHVVRPLRYHWRPAHANDEDPTVNTGSGGSEYSSANI
jgi:hypothetical protein